MASLPSLFFVLASTCGGAFVHFLIQLYKARTDFYHSKVKKGLPMPKWNPIFGHLLALKVSLDKHKLPPDVQHPDSLVHLCQEYGAESDSLIYLDFWPFVGPLMLVSSPDYAIQACQQTDVANERPADLLWSMHAVTGGPSIFAVNGSEWKDIRSIVSSAFNSNYILSQTGHVVDEAEVYVGILKKRAEEKKMFLFDEDAIKYTMDLSSRVTL